MVLLPRFHLGQQARGVPGQDHLHPSFGGAATAPFPGDLHQHPVAIPGVVELVVADIDVLATVVPEGETEPFAGAAKSGRHQVGMVQLLNSRVRLRHNRQSHQGIEADTQLLPLLIAAEGEGFLQILEGEGIRVRQLVEQVSDRELHRGVEAGSRRTRLECGKERRSGAGPGGGLLSPEAGAAPIWFRWPGRCRGGGAMERDWPAGDGACQRWNGLVPQLAPGRRRNRVPGVGVALKRTDLAPGLRDSAIRPGWPPAEAHRTLGSGALPILAVRGPQDESRPQN